ncbi:MAG: hypothetical protein JSU89_07465 [Myxococcales bacterium]|nr:MAG: hypothetical protein JSU89_07465 [Myxococcales bacterium]
MNATPAQALRALEDAFAEAHVFITEAHQLGGLALVMHWDMEGDHRRQLEAALLEVLLRLDIASRQRLHEPWEGPLEGSLYVALEHEGPDDKVKVPSVPG